MMRLTAGHSVEGGGVFDEKEMVNLVDSSLEFWLTYGRWSKEFEKRKHKKVGESHG